MKRCVQISTKNLYIYIYKRKHSIYCYYAFVESRQQPRYLLIFYIFFSLFKLFFSLIIKKKKKDLFFSLLIHTYCYIFFPTFFSSFLSLNLPTTFNFMVTLLSSSFIYFDSSSLHFILYRFNIVFFIQSIFPPPPKL